jgi:phosphate/sulfate permease
MTEGAHFNSAFDFGYTSFVFSAITGFCIGGSALANIIGMGYLNKRLSMTNALIISVVFETIGNLFLSRYILKATITKTMYLLGNRMDGENFKTVFESDLSGERKT